MHKLFDLQLFDDGGQGAPAGQQGGTAGNGNGGQNAGTSGTGAGTFSFEQAEEIANARAQRAEKAALASYFTQQGLSEDEVTKAIAAYKAQQAANKPNVDTITKERDDALKELAALKNSATLRAKGVRDEDIDYVMFKVSALMELDGKLDFEKAVTKYLKDNPRFATGGSSYRVKTGTDGSNQGGSSGQGTNDAINNAIRKAARR